MDWIPVVFVVFKVLVLAVGMFFAVKWHYDQGKKKKTMATGEVVRAGFKVAAIFVLSLLGVGLFAYTLMKMLNLDMG
ncbi:MAG: hypothetical protein ACXU8U_11940 [Asticcacaulis sp.]